MEYFLMHKNLPVLLFDLDDCYIQVLQNDFLPLPLKDCIQTTTTRDTRKTMNDLFWLRDFLLGRILNFSRTNAKTVLNSCGFSQSQSPAEKLKIVFACHGVSMTDCYWIKRPEESLKWEDVNLRRNLTKEHAEISYKVAILGQNIAIGTATSSPLPPLCADLTTFGMYPKFWQAEQGREGKNEENLKNKENGKNGNNGKKRQTDPWQQDAQRKVMWQQDIQNVHGKADINIRIGNVGDGVGTDADIGIDAGTGIYFWKTDTTRNFVNTTAELQVSDILDQTIVPHVRYRRKERDGKVFAVSECFVDESVSFVAAQQVIDWCRRKGDNFWEAMSKQIPDFQRNFANMCICDYVLANGDRHNENWGFLVSNDTNELISFAPLFDHNQALVADYMNVNVDGMIHDASDLRFADMVDRYAGEADVVFEEGILPGKCLGRYGKVRGER